MSVFVKPTQPLQKIADDQELIPVNGATVMQCLEDLMQRYPGARDYLYDSAGDVTLFIVLNGKPLPQQDLNYPVKDNDTIWLMSIVTGG